MKSAKLKIHFFFYVFTLTFYAYIMAKFPTLVTGIDIGTGSIKIVVAQKKSAEGDWKRFTPASDLPGACAAGWWWTIEAAAKCGARSG